MDFRPSFVLKTDQKKIGHVLQKGLEVLSSPFSQSCNNEEWGIPSLILYNILAHSLCFSDGKSTLSSSMDLNYLRLRSELRMGKNEDFKKK